MKVSKNTILQSNTTSSTNHVQPFIWNDFVHTFAEQETYLSPNRKRICNNKLEKLRQIFPFTITVSIQSSTNQPTNHNKHHTTIKNIHNLVSCVRALHTRIQFKKNYQTNSRMSSEFFHVMFNNKIVTAAGSNWFNRCFWGI